MNEELVMINYRTPGPGEPCRNSCGFNVVIDDATAKALLIGASVLCQPCAIELGTTHPEAFRRADEMQKFIQ
jgi:hypothetical protein